MSNIRDALLRIVKATRKIDEYRMAAQKIGLNDEFLYDAYGDLLDGIFALIGEKLVEPLEFTDSITYSVMSDHGMSDMRKTELLMKEYARNFPEQPAPVLITEKERKQMFKESGGYYTPEGEWNK